MTRNVHFTASHAETARAALSVLTARYGQAPLAEADVVVALGGDGFMLQTLHATQGRGLPVYGMNRGTVGFLMNAYAEDDLTDRLALADRLGREERIERFRNDFRRRGDIERRLADEVEPLFDAARDVEDETLGDPVGIGPEAPGAAELAPPLGG